MPLIHVYPVRTCIFLLIAFVCAVLLPGVPECRADHIAGHIDPARLRARINLTETEKQWIAEHPEIRVRVGRWPPFMMTSDGIEGISIDYLRIVAEVHGLTFTYLTEKDMSWPDALSNIAERRKVDMVPAVQSTLKRREFMLFTIPYQTLPWVIVTTDDAPFVGSMDDLSGKKVSIQKHFILERKIREQYPGADLAVVDTPTPTLDSLKQVAVGTSSATVNALPIVEYFIRQYGMTNLKVAAPAGFSDLRLSMGIRKDWPELASIIDKTLRAMTRKDTAAIQNAWLSVDYEYGVSYTTVLFASLLFAVLVPTIIGLFIMINRTLKRQVSERTLDLQRELAERRRIEDALVESLHEKDVLLREIHHRVKNNLQVISSLLSLQEAFTGKREIPEVLQECRNRVLSMALVHEKLYQSENMADIRLDEYVRSLVGRLSASLSVNNTQFDISADNVPLTIEQAIPCGLIINELVTNAVKHAFDKDADNIITVTVRGENNTVFLTVADNGRGLPENMDIRRPGSLGLSLVDSLAAQLKGELSIARNNGTSFTLVFTKRQHANA